MRKKLRTLGIRFQEEYQSVRLQEESYGMSFATPDFLLLDHVLINNFPISWIDTKAMFGTAKSDKFEATLQQITKYTAEWGYGCIYYHQGFSSSLVSQFPNTLILDNQSLSSLVVESVSQFQDQAFKGKTKRNTNLTTKFVTLKPATILRTPQTNKLSQQSAQPTASVTCTSTEGQNKTKVNLTLGYSHQEGGERQSKESHKKRKRRDSDKTDGEGKKKKQVAETQI
eukprot:TRINITY_DN6724_c0_g1_i12.p1 TRINITY_DN6724_c0_g1~~TRINITY_DN6724_c0_g1_i12.p1  ORF type:complete len:227 (-),score=43.67 TRINITY_DN6724_c0_g1_i12:310-990(-)